MSTAQRLADQMTDAATSIWAGVLATRCNEPLAKYSPSMTPQLEQQRTEHIAKQEWIESVQCVAPWNRLLAFTKIHRHLSDEDYWTLLGDVWRDYDDTFQTKEVWRAAFLMPRAGNKAFMETAEHRKFYASLPDEIKAYRGFGLNNREGFNYSLNPDVAKTYASGHGDDGDYETKILSKRDCLWVGTWSKQIIYVPGMGDAQDLAREQ